MDALVTDLIEATRERLRRLNVHSVAQVRLHAARLVALSPRGAAENKGLKKFLYRNLYAHHDISVERKRIVRSVEGLFKYFLQHPRSLPPSYFGKTQQEPAYRVVCDYIAGMTDNYLLDQYRKHLGD